MNKKFLLLALALISALSINAKPRIDRAEPLCWWTEMHCPLTLMPWDSMFRVFKRVSFLAS